MRWWAAIVGPPGSEARFFGSLLSAHLRVPLLSVHGAATVERAHRTYAGQQIDELVASQPGQLYPAALVAQLVQGPLQRAQQTSSGLVSANFPRNRVQWRMLRTFAPAPHVISLTATRDELDARVRIRRVCAACGAPMYPPPEATLKAAAAAAAERGQPMPSLSSELYSHLVEAGCVESAPRRLESDEGTPLEARWRVYEEHTRPLLEELREAGMAEVSEVELADEPDETWRRILRACGAPEDS